MSSPVGSQKKTAELQPQHDGSFISGRTIFRMLFYTFLMVTLPISSYFFSKSMVFEDFFELSEEASVIPSALTAVVMVHVVLALFVYAAYTEDVPTKKKQE